MLYASWPKNGRDQHSRTGLVQKQLPHFHGDNGVKRRSMGIPLEKLSRNGVA